MKLQLRRNKFSRQSGMMLLDVLLYISMLMVVVGLAFAVFYSTLNHTMRLSRNAADITRAAQAGELWRSDVRAAIAPPKATEADGRTILHLRHAQGEVIYSYKSNTVFRQIGAASTAVPVLTEVAASRMLLDRRHDVNSCRWELELERDAKPAKLKPLFTFQAVPAFKMTNVQ